jgi:hypothetical protein
MNLRYFLNRWVIVGGLVIAGTLLLMTLITIGWTSPRFSRTVGFVPADLTMIPAPTHTPNVMPTSTIDPQLPTPTHAADSFGLGGYVQIKGTEGEGLRIRSAPGLNSDTVFRGEDAEVFVIKDGPQSTDGYTWWYLVAPYDSTRAGWAASDFLSVVPAP